MEIQKLKEKQLQLQHELGTPEVFRDPQKIKNLSMELSKIEKELDQIQKLEDISRQIRDTQYLTQNTDNDLSRLAQTELADLVREGLDEFVFSGRGVEVEALGHAFDDECQIIGGVIEKFDECFGALFAQKRVGVASQGDGND